MTITLTVSGRIASVDATAHVVAGNTYPVALSLDSEWTGSLYLRVRFGSLYYDIPFASTDASVDVQMPVGYPEVGVGVFSEALEICSCEARVRLLRSILEAGEQVVEFDSDLYDQWAGEVTTLLTDDAFDAESTRPVQNAVLTAWKDTVPLDSALVHKTGNETINGNKTFTARMFVREPSIPSIHVVSETAYTTTGWKGLVGFFDQKDGANNEAAGIYTSVASGEINLGLRVHKPNRSGQFDTIIRSYDDHQIIITTPYYPTDSGGNPQPIGANALITSGNIAVDPRLVHTTGNETVAGAKTFTSLLTASNVQVKDASTPTVTMLKGSTEVANLASDGTQAGITASSQFFGLRGLDATPFGQAPSYTADNSADGKIVTRSMLATTPTVVHTTGNETIAGTKTFSYAIVNANSLDNRHTDVVGWTSQTENWWQVYTATLQNYSRGTMVHIIDLNNHRYGIFMFSGYGSTLSAYRYLGTFSVSRIRLARKGSTMTLFVSTAGSTNRVHLWCSQDTQSLSNSPHPNTPVLVKVADKTAGAEPVVGSDWDDVITPVEVTE